MTNITISKRNDDFSIGTVLVLWVEKIHSKLLIITIQKFQFYFCLEIGLTICSKSLNLLLIVCLVNATNYLVGSLLCELSF